MTRLAHYQHLYPFVDLTRTESGVLTMRLHRDGGPFKWTSDEGGAHDQVGAALWNVARDPDNYVVILTGTGNEFLTEHVPDEYAPFNSDNWGRLTREGKDIMTGLVEIDRPLITIANGPATLHPEIAVLGDVVLSADDAIFQDSHVVRGNVPGDGCQSVWLELLGLNRGRTFLMTGQTLTAQDLHALGVIAEIHPRDRLMQRALEIAESWLHLPPQVMAQAHMALTDTFKRRVLAEIGYGFALEGLGKYVSAERASQSSTNGLRKR